MRICPGCGIIAPLQRASCNVCQAAFVPLEAPGRAGPLLFACIHAADFACSACGQRSPLLTIDLSGRAECLRCGLVQEFDTVQWTDALGFAHGVADALGFAHGVADVSGPAQDPVAARSRHAQIGIQFTSSTKTQNGLVMDARGTRKHTLAISVSPGHPLCTCKAPLEARVDPAGHVAQTRCPRCGEQSTYAFPDGAPATYPPLRAVLANEQRTDKPVARTVPSAGGVESAACPQCGAALPAGAGAEIVKCVYCNVTTRVPGRLARRQALRAAAGESPRMAPIWILVEGPSPNRRKLERGKSEDDDDDDDVPDASIPFVVVPPGGAAPAYVQAPARSSGSRVGLIVGIAIAIVVVLALTGGAVAFVLANNADDPTPKPAPARPAPPARKQH